MGKRLEFLQRMLLKFADIGDVVVTPIMTDKGEILLIDAELPAVGVSVAIKTEEGIQNMPDDGEYLYNNETLVIENGVITAINEPAQTQQEEDMEKKLKLADEASLPEVIDKVNELIDSVNELAGEVEDLGGNADDAKIEEELKAVKEELSALKVISEKTAVSLEKIGNASNGSFTDPNPKTAKTTVKMSNAEYMAKINKR